jgi:hypothetical protein
MDWLRNPCLSVAISSAITIPIEVITGLAWTLSLAPATASAAEVCSSALKIPAQTNTSKQVRSPKGYDGMNYQGTKARP